LPMKNRTGESTRIPARAPTQRAVRVGAWIQLTFWISVLGLLPAGTGAKASIAALAGAEIPLFSV
jgi:hypothetical protein